MARSKLAERLRASRIVARRELRFSVLGIGIYLTVFLSFLVSYFLIRNYVSSIGTSGGVMIMANPLNSPFYVCIIVSSIFLALSSAISIAREREQGTMEVLFYGPVDTASYLFGKFLEHMGTYLVMLAFYVLFFFLASVVTNFGFTLGFAKIVFLSLFIVSSMISFGTLVSTVASKVRNAVLLFLGLMLFFLGLQFLSSVLGSIQPDNLSSIAAYMRAFVSAIVAGVQWFSPFSYLTRGIEAVEQGSTIRYLVSLGSSIVYSVVLMVASGILFERRGVRRG